METPTLNISVLPSTDGAAAQVHLLTGPAPSPINLTSYRVNGNIHAVNEYLRVREVDKSTAVILFDTSKKSISLTTHEHHPVNTHITGTLALNPIFEDFGINVEGKSYNNEKLAKLLRMNKHYWPDTTDDVLTKLRHLQVKINTEIEAKKDNLGNQVASFSKQVAENTLPKQLTLRAPIYIGDEPKNILVDVIVDVSGAQVVLSLESAELTFFAQQDAEKHFTFYNEQFSHNGYCCIVS